MQKSLEKTTTKMCCTRKNVKKRWMRGRERERIKTCIELEQTENCFLMNQKRKVNFHSQVHICWHWIFVV